MSGRDQVGVGRGAAGHERDHWGRGDHSQQQLLPLRGPPVVQCQWYRMLNMYNIL